MKFLKYSSTVKIIDTKKMFDHYEYIIKLINKAFLKRKNNCPHCNSRQIIKYGHFGENKQRYKCKACGKTFNIYTYTILSYSKKDVKDWIAYINCMLRKLTVRSSAGEIKISNTTSFYWRHKILKLLKDEMPNDLCGIIEVKTSYSIENLKGRRYRCSQIVDNSKKDRRISTICCVDRRGDIFSKVVCRGTMNYRSVEETLKDRIASNSILCLDNNMAYVSFAKKYKLRFHKINYARQIVNFRFHILNAIGFIKNVQDLIHCFRGVATRYLNFYLNWIKWIDVMKRQTVGQYVNNFLDMVTKKYIFRIYDFKMIGELGQYTRL
ncbi:IS1595 family transposase [Clostridium oryzae]|uniref:ISXO2-like transposase domain-containing protein n=1 Tax=Clostridium oryzae TaxID=1450648 RepID=A0A1V4J0B4_9CLOT|nr:IS1595 family transposase [Clostridium oryzae]OPJ65097.1 hypothetical protein CLORY_00970 [Clostridium oryzae]